jgi:XTP/dITP diphosphohydrolase
MNPNTSNKELQKAAFERLLVIMDELRLKCPWDKKQTWESLSPLSIEELYELTDAIEAGNKKDIKGELGDLFLHLVFYSKIADEEGEFDVADVLNTICEKLIARHPHIYGDLVLEDAEAVKQNWEKLKLKEGRTSVLEGVPKALPALIKATRIQDKVAKVGFDWDNKADVWAKVLEELEEFDETQTQNFEQHKAEEEFGDLLFALVNYARFANIDPETALRKANNKFTTRFQYIEQHAKPSIAELNLQQMEALWQEAKKTGL